MKKTLSDGTQKDVSLDYIIRKLGNWNRKGGDPVYTKPITVIKIDGDEFVWKHDEILKLIEAYVMADIESINMINDPKENTGNVKYTEESLIRKIGKKLIELNRISDKMQTFIKEKTETFKKESKSEIYK